MICSNLPGEQGYRLFGDFTQRTYLNTHFPVSDIDLIHAPFFLVVAFGFSEPT